MCAIGHRLALFAPAYRLVQDKLAARKDPELPRMLRNLINFDRMATATAIDRIVHHSVILEFDVPSYRTNAAQNRQLDKESDRPE